MSNENIAGAGARELGVLDALENLREEMIARLPENIFVNKFLPLFASEAENVDISEWLNVSVNTYLPVDVINTKGEVLYRVPPLTRELPTKLSRRGQDSVYEMMETVAKKSSVNPNLGNNYLDRQLDLRIARLGVTPEEVVIWNDIFTRYGYKPIAEINGVEVSDSSEKEDLFSDGYDPL